MLASDFESAPELRDEIKAAVVKHLIDRNVTDRIEISDQAVRNYYEENSSAIRGEVVRASEILMDRPEECES